MNVPQVSWRLFALAAPVIWCLGIAWPTVCVAGGPAGIEQVSVFARGEGDYHTYRIPAVILAANGDVLAFCEGRQDGRGDSGNIDLLMKRSTDGGKTWGKTQVVWNDGPNTCGNPCPVLDASTGTIHLLMTHNYGDDSEAEIKLRTGKGTRTVWITSSGDHGANWSPPREITKQAKAPDWDWYATGPGIGIQIARGPHAGRLVVPCDHSFHDPNGTRQDVQSEYGAHVIYSDDHGETWKYSEAIVPGMNECQLVELADPVGGLLINMRSYRGHDCRARSYSEDGGQTWSKPEDVPALIEPVCQAGLIRATPPTETDAGLLVFSNPASQKRVNMTVRTSRDDGNHWSEGLSLWSGPSAYSCLVALPEETIGCLYERGARSAYESLTFARIPIRQIE